jgi:DNA-binding NtrC family response regulator
MIGISHSLRSVTNLLERFSACDLPVLIEGETGTGKELAARALHYASSRRDMPFVPVNCGAIPDSLIENEVFGHKKGAFTDAKEDQRGVIALAEGGTLFLDEIDGLSPKGQVLLLRFLQDREYRQVGSANVLTANIRIVAATNVDLQKMADKGGFRADLLFRLKILYVALPPLRERVEDISVLSEHFLSLCSEHLKKPRKTFHPDVLCLLRTHSWPGNVRELENFVYRAFLMTDAPEIGLHNVVDILELHPIGPESTKLGSLDVSFHRAKAHAITLFEHKYLSGLMERARGNVTAAAKLAGTERRYLGKLLKKHNIVSNSSRA